MMTNHRVKAKMIRMRNYARLGETGERSSKTLEAVKLTLDIRQMTHAAKHADKGYARSALTQNQDNVSYALRA